MNCPHCGRETGSDKETCLHCGYLLGSSAELNSTSTMPTVRTSDDRRPVTSKWSDYMPWLFIAFIVFDAMTLGGLLVYIFVLKNSNIWVIVTLVFIDVAITLGIVYLLITGQTKIKRADDPHKR